jgi:hypothetical protein
MMFQGGCHCGAIRFLVTTEKRVVLDCNCSMCTKKGFLHLIVEADEFQLLTGQDRLSEYRFGTGTARHLFCSTCGVHAHYVPRSHPDGFSVNFRCLDDQESLRDQFEFRAFAGTQWEENINSIR